MPYIVVFASVDTVDKFRRILTADHTNDTDFLFEIPVFVREVESSNRRFAVRCVVRG
jgi:hypothetical protein